MKKTILLSLVASFGTAATFSVAAQNYPVRPIRMVVPFAPGGASDVVGRILSPRFSQELGQQIVIDNRAGASGNIGVETVAKAQPDGYTILLGNSGTMAINPSILPKFPIKPVRDLFAVTQIVDVPGILVAHPSVTANSVKEFIDYAKARPGKLNYGSAGAGSPQRLAMEYFMRAAGIDLLHVPYKGGAGAATVAVLAGEVSAVMTSVAAVLPHVRVNKLKAYSVVAPKRLSVLPETPTMVESGFPSMTAGAWQGIYAPVGTPRAVVNRLFSAANKVVTEPDLTKRMNEAGAEVIVSKSPEDFAAFMKKENELYAKLVKEIGVVLE